MITDAMQIERVIGARGINPQNRLNEDFELIDRLDGLGIQFRFWNEVTLGAVPTQQELTLATSPRLSLSQQSNQAGDGIIVTCQLGDTTDSVINWRCVDPDGEVYTASDSADNGQGSWEILTGKVGVYQVSAWANTYGYAALSAEGV
jgi:hypothetical protein